MCRSSNAESSIDCGEILHPLETAIKLYINLHLLTIVQSRAKCPVHLES